VLSPWHEVGRNRWFAWLFPGSHTRRRSVQGAGAPLELAGIYLPDGTHHGVGGEFFIDEEGNVDPVADAALCGALEPTPT